MSKLLQESSVCPLTCIYKIAIVGVSTQIVLSMGIRTHTHNAMHDQRKLCLNNMLVLESLVTRLSKIVRCELLYEYGVF